MEKLAKKAIDYSCSGDFDRPRESAASDYGHWRIAGKKSNLGNLRGNRNPKRIQKIKANLIEIVVSRTISLMHQRRKGLLKRQTNLFTLVIENSRTAHPYFRFERVNFFSKKQNL